MSGKISFVLPITLNETGAAWRASVNIGALSRTKLLLRSFVTKFCQDDLAELLLISPARDAPFLVSLLRSVTRDPRYKVIPEAEICADLEKAVDTKTGDARGWRIQQLLKLAISAHVSSEYYVTLDSDIVCFRRFSYDDLIMDSRAVTNCETSADYMRIYTEAFAAKEIEIKRRRYATSGELLGRFLGPPRMRFYGETPAVLCTQMVSRLLEFLVGRFDGKWSEFLARKGGWTEYGLYYNFLEMTEQLDSRCFLVGCNGVLDLERSIWQVSKHYRHVRRYDVDHFTRNDTGRESGPFIAIQSWLPVSSWLPERCVTLDGFYQELQGWLDTRDRDLNMTACGL